MGQVTKVLRVEARNSGTDSRHGNLLEAGLERRPPCFRSSRVKKVVTFFTRDGHVLKIIIDRSGVQRSIRSEKEVIQCERLFLMPSTLTSVLDQSEEKSSA